MSGNPTLNLKPSTGIDANKDTVSTISPVENNEYTVESKEDLNKQYLYKRSFVVATKKYKASLFKMSNITAFDLSETIGSCVTSSTALTSNQYELERLFPQLVGLSPANSEFMSRCKSWLNNISHTVSGSHTFDNSLMFKTKLDYLEFKSKYDKITETYKEANRSGSSNLKMALTLKINAIISLEQEYGDRFTPINISDYVMYRHCLLYNRIAKDPLALQFTPIATMYVRDVEQEAKVRKNEFKERQIANTNLAALSNNPNKLRAIYIVYLVAHNQFTDTNLNKPDIEKEMELTDYVTYNAKKFNQWCRDPDIDIRATIERAINIGELQRPDYSQNIFTAANEFIAANLGEAVQYFKSPENADKFQALKNKITLI